MELHKILAHVGMYCSGRLSLVYFIINILGPYFRYGRYGWMEYKLVV